MSKLNLLRKNLNESIVGREKEIDFMLIALIQGGHVLLESVPGSGKTMMAKSFAHAFKGNFKRLQFTPDVLPSDVTGISYFDPKTQEFVLRTGPVATNILLADEINRATPRTQSSLLEAMEEKQVTIDGETIVLPNPFMVIATQNPVESQQGTFSLPAAQLDRFLFRIEISYPSFEEERRILREFSQNPGEVKTSSIIDIEDVQQWRREVRNVTVHEDIETYILQIIQATRQHAHVELGLSSRASLALLHAAQGYAFINGRTYVTPDDVKKMVPPLATHRLILSAEGLLVREPAQILHDIIDSVQTPVEAMAR
ncbi:MoxR family ATPase [Paenisporosarcina quisquiliarum]|uniref:MoxR family ATPase n=1 Tax=Paenisporosarcina quisquiliarum TaxID=365346 RepID=A0A9X3LHH7_9BACL|nr:MoxR family ATPase [Paenisporosarcina quisquiliarum]MCZ8536499.1 MoxR family ATPase [Paenisporosarcina quisquiliarum]